MCPTPDCRKVGCSCGCGELIDSRDSRGRPVSFKRGHGHRTVRMMELKFCGCGCKQFLHNPKIAKYMIGHNRRGRHFPNEDYSTRSGKNNHKWKGGRPISTSGYVISYQKQDPRAYNDHGHMYEHRIIMEKHLGRKLQSVEIVHHKNGNKLDNRIENLEIVNRSQHNRIHKFLHR